jgi:carboxyl-terminal processing protease
MINFIGSKLLKIITGITLIFSIIILPIFLKASSAQDSPYQATLNQVWQEVNDHFFDPNFNGVDWKARRQEYENRLKPAQSLEEASVVINQMLSELKTSHTHFYTKQEPAYYQLLGIFNRGSFKKELEEIFPNGKLDYTGIGIFTKDINGKTFISGIIEGTPAASSGLKVGDEVIAVDGKPYQPIQSFVSKAEQKVKVSIQQSPDPRSRKA